MPEIETALEAFGLTTKEAKIYLALLELGESTVLRLSEVTGINRTTLYDILKALARKGIIGTTDKEKIKYFSPAKPTVLLDALKRRQQAVERALPELIRRTATLGAKPKIQFYEGKEGIDAVHQDVLSAKNIRAYGSFSIIDKAAKYQSLDFRKKRIQAKISMTAVTDASAKAIELLEKPEYRALTKLYVDPTLRELPVWTYIYENKVATLLFEKEQFYCHIIESPSMFAKEEYVFNKLLESAKPLE
ncbi:hypothetical protein HY489_03455 [Candidatus Woesearchaeota archaeon]|nr:hypothetical protein [Candidatus Woesearchaeota archaeon]